jgi:hypothetical protein
MDFPNFFAGQPKHFDSHSLAQIHALDHDILALEKLGKSFRAVSTEAPALDDSSRTCHFADCANQKIFARQCASVDIFLGCTVAFGDSLSTRLEDFLGRHGI